MLNSIFAGKLFTSILALTFGGVALLVGVVGLGTLLVVSGRSIAIGGRFRQGLLLFGGILLVLAGASLLAIGIKRPLEALNDARRLVDASTYLQVTYQIQAEQAIRAILSRPRYGDPKKLNRHEYRVFSQGGEDGIIAEIFRRIGTTSRKFVEFGSSDGFENNSVLLLRQGWGGLWIDGDHTAVTRARAHFRPEIEARRLKITEAFITAENIEELLREGAVPEEPDLLSIDIDRNDYYVWDRITHYRPRVVVIEYNPLFPPTMSWVIPYDPKAMWDGTTRTGASLKALEELGTRKGYSLVAAGITGVNAFFVRSDLLEDRFSSPYTAENHYEPARYYIYNFDSNHKRVP